MKPVLIPPHVLPLNNRVIIGGEHGTTAAEYVVERDDDYVVKLSTLIELDDDDLERMTRSRLLWLTLHGGEIPWTLGIAVLSDDHPAVDVDPSVEQDDAGEVCGEHVSEIAYTTNDDGVHLGCATCDWSVELGFSPTLEAAVDLWQSHLDEVGR